ncbi:hypothetical protein E4U21_000494 [Claviceps maximensis]|nr:hypothetical protein E4U21_000494 [Claviceps maximensis]
MDSHSNRQALFSEAHIATARHVTMSSSPAFPEAGHASRLFRTLKESSDQSLAERLLRLTEPAEAGSSNGASNNSPGSTAAAAESKNKNGCVDGDKLADQKNGNSTTNDK